MALTKLALRQTVAGELQQRFLVTPTGPASASVEVSAGTVFSMLTHEEFIGADSTEGPFSSVAPGFIRHDLLYFDTTIEDYAIVQGTPVASSTVGMAGQPQLTDPAYIPLAFVKITETGTVVISDADIVDCRPFLTDGNFRIRYAESTGNYYVKATELFHVMGNTGHWTAAQNSSLATLLDELGSRVSANDAATALIPGIQATLAAKPDDFLELSDTPGAYGGANRIAAVNDAGGAMELVTPSVAKRGAQRIQDGAITIFTDFRPESWLVPGAAWSSNETRDDAHIGCRHYFLSDNGTFNYEESRDDSLSITDYGVMTAGTAGDVYPNQYAFYQMLDGAYLAQFSHYDTIAVAFRMLAPAATTKRQAFGLGVPDAGGNYSQEGVWLRHDTASWFLDYATGASITSVAISSVTLSDDNWHTIVIKMVRESNSPYDRFRIRMYVDGVELSETSGTPRYHPRQAGDPATDADNDQLRPFCIWSSDGGGNRIYIGAIGAHYSLNTDEVMGPDDLFNDGADLWKT